MHERSTQIFVPVSEIGNTLVAFLGAEAVFHSSPFPPGFVL
jgi:hypothetical protein